MIETKVSPSSARQEKIIEKKDCTNGITTSSYTNQDINTGIYGIVKWYNCKYNYGFISRLDNKQDLFVHRNGIKKCNPKKFKSLQDGDIVMFDVVCSEKGAEAKNVTGPEGKPARPSKYARFRPWYLDLIKRTRTSPVDAQSNQHNANYEKVNRNKKTIKNSSNKITEEKNLAKQVKESEQDKNDQSLNSSSGQSSVESKTETENTEASKTSSETEAKVNSKKKSEKNNFKGNFRQRDPKGRTKSHHHSCNMRERVEQAVEV